MQSNKCALILYSRLDYSNKYLMVYDTTTNTSAMDDASNISLGILTYMNFYEVINIYGKKKAEKIWTYLQLYSHSVEEGGICEMLKMSTDDEIDKVIEFVNNETIKFIETY